MHELAKTRGHTVERFEVKPSFGNIIVWRAQYMHAGTIYYDAFHTSPWNGNISYQGGSVPMFVPPENLSATQKQDLDYFTFFSDGWLAYAPEHAGLIGDMRFSMLPNQSGPIWGIRLRPDAPEEHVLFENIRKRNEGDIARLWSMIKGAKS
jgi:inner membrane protein